MWALLERELQRRGAAYEAAFTQRAGHAEELARRMAQRGGFAAVAAVGGDGTVHEVCAGLLGADVPLGAVPAGSGNDFARSMLLPGEPGAAAEALLERRTTDIDVGRAGGGVFLNSFGAGFDGEVATAANGSDRKRFLNRAGLGSMSYALTVASTLGSYRPSGVTVVVDGDTHTFDGVWLAVAANLPYFGGGMQICPAASPSDGLLDICVVHGVTRLQLLRYFPRIYAGSHVGLPYVAMLRGRRVRFVAERPLAAQADGEPAERHDEELSILQGALRVVVGPRYGAGRA